jgi:hypothetical protein
VKNAIYAVPDLPTEAPDSLWEPPPVDAHTTSAVLARAAPKLPADIERAIIDALVRPLHPGESHLVGSARREREVVALFEQLAPVHALAVGRRLDAARGGDALVVAFHRLVVDRRNRLRAVLARRR